LSRYERYPDIPASAASYIELVAIWRKQSQVEPTISKCIELLFAELKSP
jgi:hypothetical protein